MSGTTGPISSVLSRNLVSETPKNFLSEVRESPVVPLVGTALSGTTALLVSGTTACAVVTSGSAAGTEFFLSPGFHSGSARGGTALSGTTASVGRYYRLVYSVLFAE